MRLTSAPDSAPRMMGDPLVERLGAAADAGHAIALNTCRHTRLTQNDNMIEANNHCNPIT
jgi:hypothetical protein